MPLELEGYETQVAAEGAFGLRMASALRSDLVRPSIAAEFRDDDGGVHIVRPGFLADALGLAMGRGASRSRRLRMAAPMHDVGKTAPANRAA